VTDTPDSPDLTDSIAAFIAGARWFGGKGRDFHVTGVRRLGTVGEHPGVVIDLAQVTYEGGDTELYQLPLAHYPEAQERLEHALVGTVDDPDLGPSYVYDALHDREAMAHLLRAFAAEESAGALGFHRLPGYDLDLDAHSTRFSGEQSNSTVMFGDDSLLKVFRKITPGANPDVAIHEVLTRAGSDHVAALYGWLEVTAPPGSGEGPLQLAMLQQFLRTASDGWDLALASIRNLFAEGDLHADEVGGDFAGESARLGESLAEVHRVLAEHFPTRRRPADEMAALGAAMTSRLDAALAVAPDLEPHGPALREIFAAVGHLDGIEVQQVHGDLHLGQTLRTVKGWKVVDFEGEPAKPLAERLLPDSVWRDVAGMLRSFDYAPGVASHSLGNADGGASQRAFRAAEWSARNCSAFLDAYIGREPTEAERTLLAAYEADKAVYEVVYEVRNRPKWVDIPMAAIERLAHR